MKQLREISAEKAQCARALRLLRKACLPWNRQPKPALAVRRLHGRKRTRRASQYAEEEDESNGVDFGAGAYVDMAATGLEDAEDAEEQDMETAAGFAEAEEEAIMAGGEAAPVLDFDDDAPLMDLFKPGRPAKPAPPNTQGVPTAKRNAYAKYGRLPH